MYLCFIVVKWLRIEKAEQACVKLRNHSVAQYLTSSTANLLCN